MEGLVGVLRVFLPITDIDMPLSALMIEAEAQLPFIAARHKVRIDTNAKVDWRIVRSVDTPGSGCVTEWGLLLHVHEVAIRHDIPAQADIPAEPHGPLRRNGHASCTVCGRRYTANWNSVKARLCTACKKQGYAA